MKEWYVAPTISWLRALSSNLTPALGRKPDKSEHHGGQPWAFNSNN
jgi:hypothetical protein